MIAIAVLMAVLLFAWVAYYNSPEQRLQRCVHAEFSAYDVDPQSQRLRNYGVGPPVVLLREDCKQKLGIQ